ncbi:CCA tRNA nucleotidyltransferase [Donghicola mangrovi]|uniref:CCA tRNA nucleotidyltransferase n=1 Tax=Donghicola mangrovi TaxID=2729614 RepID=A0A850Q5L2_9RHOB|nr:CCA tRNA nucleotidyltransferase [Donghicola mangrovi]NVO22358.1 CCA tRNA nucleotidyltransferase [Donghicola mangrovi]
MKAAGAWITRPATQAVCAMLVEAGYQAWFVGGCVRNALIYAPVDDIDICTNARPETVMELATAAGLKPVPTGIDHGTITVVSGGIGHEVTTFRRDVETDGRHAVVAFSDRMEEDAARRDFTMNALYADRNGDVADPLGGLPDLEARHVRFIGDPHQRIREDYLRILRFFRFTAWYGNPALGIDADGLAACAELSDGIETLAAERLGAEMCKLLRAVDPSRAVAAMAQSGVLMQVLPGADHTALAPCVHLEVEAGLEPDAMLRLATLGDCDAPTRLRLSKADAKSLTDLRTAAIEGAPAHEIGYRMGATQGLRAMILRAALMGVPMTDDAEVALGATAKFPVKAADLMPHYSGAQLGLRLRQLEKRWIEDHFAPTRDDLLNSPD